MVRPDTPILIDVAAAGFPTSGTVLVADPAILEPGSPPPLGDLELAAIVDLDSGQPGSSSRQGAGHDRPAGTTSRSSAGRAGAAGELHRSSAGRIGNI